MPEIKVCVMYDDLTCDNFIGWSGALFHKDCWLIVTDIYGSPGEAADAAFAAWIANPKDWTNQ